MRSIALSRLLSSTEEVPPHEAAPAWSAAPVLVTVFELLLMLLMSRPNCGLALTLDEDEEFDEDDGLGEADDVDRDRLEDRFERPPKNTDDLRDGGKGMGKDRRPEGWCVNRNLKQSPYTLYANIP